MQFDGVLVLTRSRTEIWLALNDPEILQASIPGCERLTSIGLGRFETVVVATVGPVRARLNGVLEVADVVVHESYTLRFALQAGAAGFGEGTVRVALRDELPGSSVHYAAHALVGGKLAQLGSRLIEGSARKLAARFFESFSVALDGRKTGVRQSG